MTTYELCPAYNQNQKSFYGKARVIEHEGVRTLYSYDTPIMKAEGGKFIRLWSGWTATTGRHIKAFSGMNKKEFDKLEMEEN